MKISEDIYTKWCVDSAGKSVGATTEQYDAITAAATLCP